MKYVHPSENYFGTPGPLYLGTPGLYLGPWTYLVLPGLIWDPLDYLRRPDLFGSPEQLEFAVFKIRRIRFSKYGG